MEMSFHTSPAVSSRLSSKGGNQPSLPTPRASGPACPQAASPRSPHPSRSLGSWAELGGSCSGPKGQALLVQQEGPQRSWHLNLWGRSLPRHCPNLLALKLERNLVFALSRGCKSEGKYVCMICHFV